MVYNTSKLKKNQIRDIDIDASDLVLPQDREESVVQVQGRDRLDRPFFQYTNNDSDEDNKY